MSDDILDTIDKAVLDWTVSLDAMRVKPDAPASARVDWTASLDAPIPECSPAARRVWVEWTFHCATCTARRRASPRPLAIDGHAYRRRVRSR